MPNFRYRKQVKVVGWVDLLLTITGLIVLIVMLGLLSDRKDYAYHSAKCSYYISSGSGSITEMSWILPQLLDKTLSFYTAENYDSAPSWKCWTTIIISIVCNIVQIIAAIVLINAADEFPRKALCMISFWNWATIIVLLFDLVYYFYLGLYIGLINLLVPVCFLVLVNQHKRKLEGALYEEVQEQRHGMVTY